MDYSKLLGGKYARPTAAPSVAPETTGAGPATVEGSESKPANKPTDTAGRRSTGKSGQGTSSKGKS